MGAVTRRAPYAPMVEALRRLLDLDEPEWTHVHRWGMAKPQGTHEATYHLSDGPLGRTASSATSGPWRHPRVESAWRSGVDLARALLAD